MGDTPAVVHYAFGGGLGHLVRAGAVRRILSSGGRFVVLTSNHATDDPRVVEGLEIRSPPEGSANDPRALGAWVRDRLDEIRPETFSVDAFPAGILGELSGIDLPPGVRSIHLARLLRWDRYALRSRGPLPRYDRVLAIESLGQQQEAALRASAGSWEEIELPLEPIQPGPTHRALERVWRSLGRPVWLVVHSGPLDEVRELVAWAREHAAMEGRDPHLVVASPLAEALDDPEVECLDLHPVRGLFPLADRLVTAAGWNTMRETRPWRDRHLCLPFPRPLDDQFSRARQAFLGTRPRF